MGKFRKIGLIILLLFTVTSIVLNIYFYNQNQKLENKRVEKQKEIETLKNDIVALDYIIFYLNDVSYWNMKMSTAYTYMFINKKTPEIYQIEGDKSYTYGNGLIENHKSNKLSEKTYLKFEKLKAIINKIPQVQRYYKGQQYLNDGFLETSNFNTEITNLILDISEYREKVLTEIN